MIAARLRHLALHLTALALMALWLLPVAGLVTTSLRSADQAAASGWWRAFDLQQVHLPAVAANCLARSASPPASRCQRKRAPC